MLYIGLWLLCGIVAGAIYQNKGRSGAVAFIGGLLLGPIGVILALVSSTDTKGLDQKQIASGDMKKCPYCGEMIRSEAVVCRYCQRDLNIPTPGAVGKILPIDGGYACSLCNGSVRLDDSVCRACGKPLIISAATYAKGG